MTDPRTAVDALLARHPVVVELGERFAAAGHRLYLVGGPVRDALLGREVNDLDFTTDARPEQILRVVDGWADSIWDMGIAFGTVGVGRRGASLEITTFRADAYDGDSRNPGRAASPTTSRTTWSGGTSRSTRWRSRCRTAG